MSKLRVVAYNVRFGDAILIEIPDRDGTREVTRRILIDVGNVLSGHGGDDAVFKPVLEDLIGRLDGQPIDLYVMSHEHLDHVQGLPSAADRLSLTFPVSHAWLTASADPEYASKFPAAARKIAIAESHYESIRLAATQRHVQDHPDVKAFLDNNDRTVTGPCVAFLRKMAKATRFVDREFRPTSGRDHPFKEARLSLWAPERNSTVYYGRSTPFIPKVAKKVRPPDGVDARAFSDLMTFLELGMPESMLAIDKAANDTSVVLEVEWRGWRLVFPGDAEQRSWQLMARHGVVRPAHVFKVGHHGSRNALPPDPILELLLPTKRPDARRRTAILSTFPETYPGVPDELTLSRIRARVDDFVSTTTAPSGGSVTVELDG